MGASEKLKWRDVPVCIDYEVSNAGNLRNKRNGNVLKGSLSTKGYRVVYMASKGLRLRMTLHSLVMLAWIGPRPAGMQIDHIDGDRLNNAANNLRYVTPKQNIHATIARGAHAFGTKNGQAKLTEKQVRFLRNQKATANAKGIRFWGVLRFAAELGIDPSQIRRIVRGESFSSVK